MTLSRLSPISRQFTTLGTITTETYLAFGWKVFRRVMKPGAVIAVHATEDVARADATNLVMYVRGRVKCECADGVRADRVPGTFSPEMPKHPAGVTRLLAMEESEFWCFSWEFNRRAHPAVTPVRLGADERLQLKAGTRLLVLSGVATAGSEVLVAPAQWSTDSDVELRATTPFYAFTIEEPR